MPALAQKALNFSISHNIVMNNLLGSAIMPLYVLEGMDKIIQQNNLLSRPWLLGGVNYHMEYDMVGRALIKAEFMNINMFFCIQENSRYWQVGL